MLRAHELALQAGWDRVHAALGITKPFYDRFTPAISARDFALGRARSSARSTSSRRFALEGERGARSGAARGGPPPVAAVVRAGALFASFGAILVAGFPLLPVIFTFGISEAVAGVALLALLLVQDGLLVLAAVLFASIKRRPPRWHSASVPPGCGRRWAGPLLAFALMLGIELGYIELFDVDETNVEELGEDNLVAGFAVALAVIVVAPVAEEIFFRAFFYRALRTRLPVWSAALIDGIVFGSLHFQGVDTAIILPSSRCSAWGSASCMNAPVRCSR